MMSVRFQHTAARRRLGWGVRFTTSSPTFQHTAARRRLVGVVILKNPHLLFQHTAARRRLAKQTSIRRRQTKSFNTQPPEGGWEWTNKAIQINTPVSTHSRPKAAGRPLGRPTQEKPSFNTQPPEGGWLLCRHVARLWTVSTHSRPKAAGLTRSWGIPSKASFNTQPPEGGWRSGTACHSYHAAFQHTAARRRLARSAGSLPCWQTGFNTQPPEGGWRRPRSRRRCTQRRFNTQPPEGGWLKRASSPTLRSTFQHTAARRRLELAANFVNLTKLTTFQHTAARRRLAGSKITLKLGYKVSTHSRPKAAGHQHPRKQYALKVSTHSRPKAAGDVFEFTLRFVKCFNTQPPEGGWPQILFFHTETNGFQHTAARRRLVELYGHLE